MKTTSTYRDVNFTIIVGRLVRDCEIRETTKGSVAKFRIASKNGTNRSGNEIPSTFIDCEYWNPGNVAQYLVKGKEVEIHGRLLMDEWKNKEGESRSKLYISVREISLGRSPKNSSNNESSNDDGLNREIDNFLSDDDNEKPF